MSDNKVISEVLRENKQNLQSQFHVTQIGVFGSYLRGEETEESDIDILVEFEKGHKDLFNYLHLKNYLEGIFGKGVDLVIKEAVKPKLKDVILGQVRYV
ncbi:MAG: nucleotidyltransferase family protein [Deltaproteobacteria bacterium]|nr:nucleotidyltransferase family protein [Deltaproteobacteria bacterium]